MNMPTISIFLLTLQGARNLNRDSLKARRHVVLMSAGWPIRNFNLDSGSFSAVLLPAGVVACHFFKDAWNLGCNVSRNVWRKRQDHLGTGRRDNCQKNVLLQDIDSQLHLCNGMNYERLDRA